ncbi:MAG: trypsin-like serine protease [Bacteriovoracaceae bacterium]|nr:trypsin-like serine protease [Bacteriovoracaceae bacterium]
MRDFFVIILLVFISLACDKVNATPPQKPLPLPINDVCNSLTDNSYQEFFPQSNRPGVQGVRQIAGKEYAWVGQLFLRNTPSCTAWFIAPGILATAKHCFGNNYSSRDARRNNITVHFSKTDRIIQRGDRKVVRIKEVIWDDGENDIAFLRYNPDELSSFFDVKITIAQLLPEDLSSLIVVGFPAPSQGSFSRDYLRVISSDCYGTDYQGHFPSTSFDQGYDGLLIDTTCKAWRGVSGGPIGKRVSDKEFVIYGVVTHTFDVYNDGSLNMRFIERDQFGQHGTTNFSPFSESVNLSTVYTDQ